MCGILAAANRKGEAHAAQNALALEEKIYKAITKGKYCRFHAKKPDEMREIIGEAVKQKKPIEFFMLWGVWKKVSINQADVEALEILDGMQHSVQAVYPPGFRLKIVMADAHAELNLMDKRGIYAYDAYLGAFERHANSKGIATVRLSEILPVCIPMPSSLQQEMGEIQKSGYWKILLDSAGKYYEGEDKEVGAKKYVQKRLAEKPVLEKLFGSSIFLTYNGQRYDALAPDLPTIYPIANRKRTSEKPWFVID